MSDIVKNEKNEIASQELKLDVANGGVPRDYYSQNPCLIGYTYLRFEVDGTILPCCIAKHTIGDAYQQDWREIWHSGAYENFRKKMSQIPVDRFHLQDPEWTFCQQCSHFTINKDKNDLLKIDRKEKA